MRPLWITLAVLAVAVGSAVAFYYAVLDRNYSTAEFFADTMIGPDPSRAESMTYLQQPGRLTIALIRGETESQFMTDSSWREIVGIDIPRPSAGDWIDLANPDVKVAYGRAAPFVSSVIGDRGVRGHIQVHEIDHRNLSVSYEIVIDAFSPRLQPEYQHREVTFRGRSNFRSMPRPIDRPFWSASPK